MLCLWEGDGRKRRVGSKRSEVAGPAEERKRGRAYGGGRGYEAVGRAEAGLSVQGFTPSVIFNITSKHCFGIRICS